MDKEKLKFLRECLKVLRWDIESIWIDNIYCENEDGYEHYVLVRRKSRSRVVGQCELEATSEEQLLVNNATFIEKWFQKQEGRQE